MSIAVLVSVHDGLVLAADSASTLIVSNPHGGEPVASNVYDNANKIFNLVKGRPMGCVTFGSGSIGNASIGTLIKDFRLELSVTDPKKNPYGFDIQNFTMGKVCEHLADFLGKKCSELSAENKSAINIGLLIAGYSSRESLGESWSVEIQKGAPTKPIMLRKKDEVGLNWGGQGEAIQRLVLGFSPLLFNTLAKVSQPARPPDQLFRELAPLLQNELQAPLVFAPMPIQDAIDLGRFLVHAATMFSRFLPGPQIVGGPIEIAAITKHEGFKWIARKHYYGQEFFENREPLVKEPIHVRIVND